MKTLDTEKICKELRSRLAGAVKRNAAEGILFSGGLDTSLLALLSPGIPALSVRLAGYGEDAKYAEMLAQWLGLELHLKQVSQEEALAAIPEVIKTMGSFDPALPNDLALFFALKLAREKGLGSVITGDGADELFAGYSYMFDLDLEDYLPKLSQRMVFSSSELGSYLGVEVKQPFLDDEFVSFALTIKPSLKVKEQNGKRYGKWLLRQAFTTFLPPEIIWQEKRPIETGSGFTRLREIISSRVSDQEFAEAESSYPVRFLSKDHLVYYQIYREVVGAIPPPQPGEAICPGCGTGIEASSFHCRICGWSRKPQVAKVKEGNQ